MLDIEEGETVMENVPWVFLAAMTILVVALVRAWRSRDKN